MTASSWMNRLEGGVPTLVELLEFDDPKVQRSAAGALRTLAFRNDDNKNRVNVCQFVNYRLYLILEWSMITTRFLQIIDCNALPMLIRMLGSEDAAIHYEAVILG